MAIEDAILRRSQLVNNVGKIGLNILFPKEFELYMCGLELLDESGKTLKYFLFPVMPTTIDESKTRPTSIRQTLGGITTLSSSVFAPIDITLVGSFGRRLRVLLGDVYEDIINFFDSEKQNNQTFDPRIKSGYGCIKILEDIYNEADSLEGGMKTLILHNPSIGNSYVVKPMNLKLTQSQDSNMIWNYSLSLKAIAPLDAVSHSNSTINQQQKLLINGTLQKAVNQMIDNVTRLL